MLLKYDYARNKDFIMPTTGQEGIFSNLHCQNAFSYLALERLMR